MKFAEPSFLVALALILIPILIHFLQFKRYKTVYFSQVSFLKTLLNESKKKNNLKQLVILLTRILAIVTLVLAFAQPYLPLDPDSRYSARNLVGIYVDNSFSMNSQSEKGTLLEDAKLRAIELARDFAPGTRFVLLTNEAQLETFTTLNEEQIVAAISQISSTARSLNLQQIESVFKQRFEKIESNASADIYLISDFQKHFFDFDTSEPYDIGQLFLLQFPHRSAGNVLIDTCWLELPGRLSGQNEILSASITNQSTKTLASVPVRLFLNDSLKAIKALNLPPKEATQVEFVFTNNSKGIHSCRLELDDYPITYDNTFYFSYLVQEQIQALIIHNQSDPAVQWLESVFEDDERISVSKMTSTQLQISSLDDYQCIWLLNLNSLPEGLQAALIRFIEAGGSVAVFPGNEADIISYNNFFKRAGAGSLSEKIQSPVKFDKLNLQNHLLQDVFSRQLSERVMFPEIRKFYQISLPSRSLVTTVVTNNDGNAALREFNIEQGKLYQFNFALSEESTDFHKHAVFIPLTYNIALHSYIPQIIQYQIGGSDIVQLGIKDSYSTGKPIFLNDASGKLKAQVPLLSESSGKLRLNANTYIRDAGFYHVSQDNQIIAPLAFNYNRMESDTVFCSADELNNLALQNAEIHLLSAESEDSSIAANFTTGAVELWKYFLICAIFFILTELLVIRFWK